MTNATEQPSFFVVGSPALTSDRTDWETPRDLFDRLNDFWQFDLDVAASDANHRDAVDMLVGKGFKAISDTEFVWKPPVNDDGWPLQPYEVSYPFSFGYGLEKMQATIFACDVVK